VPRRAVLAALASAPLGACAGADDERVRRVVYWEKWTGFEGEAAQRVVDAFNASERTRAAREPGYRPIEVERVTVSRMDQKLLVAIAGGNPPDVAGFFSFLIATYADKGALLELGPELARAGMKRSDYLERFFDLGVHRGRTWCVPTMPSSVALHFNKRAFREVGLDPDRAPETIEALDHAAERLTRWELSLDDGRKELRNGYAPDVPHSKKRLLRAGFLPSDPIWWSYSWGYYFGGKLLEGESRVTSDSPENLRAYAWVQRYTENLGVDAVRRFRSGFGNFSSPENPFLSGKLAMQLQGAWMYAFIERYAPALEWGVGPFPYPADRPELARTSIAEADVLLIPRGSRRPKEAFEFIKFASSRESLETMALGQQKFTPLAEVSDTFFERHDHPYIRTFRELGASPNAWSAPPIASWNEYVREMRAAVDQIQSLTSTPARALANVRSRMQTAVDRDVRALARRSSK
jgi:multiple sugar transport system substrate-binding protein